MDIIDLIINGGFMYKLKLFFIIFIVIFLCGCNSSYNLTIDEDKFIEDIELDVSNLSNRNIINNNFYPLHKNFDVLYDKNVYNEDNYSFLNLKYSYSPDEFLNSTAYSDCFSDRTFENTDDYFYFKMYKLVECYYGDDYDINIITKNKVIYNNADEVKGNTYTWHVTEDNKDSLLIEIKILKNKYSDDSVYNYLLIGIAIVIIVMVLYFLKVYKNRQLTKDDI